MLDLKSSKRWRLVSSNRFTFQALRFFCTSGSSRMLEIHSSTDTGLKGSSQSKVFKKRGVSELLEIEHVQKHFLQSSEFQSLSP